MFEIKRTAIAIALAFGTCAEAQDIRVMTYQGSHAEKFDATFGEAWRNTGNGDLLVQGVGSGEIWPRLMSGQEADLVTLETPGIRDGCASGMLKALPDEIREAGLDPEAPACGVAYARFARGFAMRTDILTDEDSVDISAFLDTDTYPGPRAISARSPKHVLELTLMASGIAPEDVYDRLSSDEGVGSALDALAALGDDLKMVQTDAFAREMIADGEAVMALGWSTRFNDMINQGVPIGALGSTAMISYDYLAAPSQTQDASAAEAFLNQTLTDDTTSGLQQLLDRIDRNQDRKYVQACARDDCPCSGGGCSKNCCSAFTSPFGFLPTSEQFWMENEDRINAMWQQWQANR